MIRLCLRESLFARKSNLAIALVACIAWASANCGAAADKPALTAARVKQLATEAIRTGKVHPIPGRTQINGDTLEVSDSGSEEESDEDAQNQYVRIFLDQVAIEVRRQSLLKRPTSRQTIEPFYAKMEQIVAKKLAVVEDSKLSEDDRATELGKLDDQLRAICEDGLQAVAKSLGLKQAVFIVGAGHEAHAVTLTATQGATIDMVRQTTAALLKDAGQPEQKFPWASYQAGDSPDLLGIYYCRISLNGKQATLSKTVAKNTTELRFPDP